MLKEVIPDKIHFIYRDSLPPPQYSVYVEKVRLLHPSWEIHIWGDEEAFTTVSDHFPGLRDMYTSYALPVQRTDIFRVMLMYLFGGFYMDLDMVCFKSLDELRRHQLVLGVEKTLSEDECIRLKHHYRTRIANYMFGSRPGHHFWLELLAAAKARADVPVRCEADVLESTGPGLLTDVFHQISSSYGDIAILPNANRTCMRSCGPASCHFGEFAAHLHMASWRWENK
jgi:mannosyltransferase OCH1-like enzyme